MQILAGADHDAYSSHDTDGMACEQISLSIYNYLLSINTAFFHYFAATSFPYRCHNILTQSQEFHLIPLFNSFFFYLS